MRSAPAPRPLPSPVGSSGLLTTPGESSGGSARPRGGALSLPSAPCLGAPSPSHTPRTNAPWKAGAPKRHLALPRKPAGGPGRLDPREDGPLTKECPRGEAGARGPLPERRLARRPEPAPHTHLLSARLEARMPSRWHAPTTETRAPRGRADPALVYQPLTRSRLPLSSENTLFVTQSSHLSLANSAGLWDAQRRGKPWGQAHEHRASPAGRAGAPRASRAGRGTRNPWGAGDPGLGRGPGLAVTCRTPVRVTSRCARGLTGVPGQRPRTPQRARGAL